MVRNGKIEGGCRSTSWVGTRKGVGPGNQTEESEAEVHREGDKEGQSNPDNGVDGEGVVTLPRDLRLRSERDG